MRRIVQERTGGPEVLVVGEAPLPELAAGEVLVRVRAAGVNPVDAAVRTGAFPLLGEPPFTVGWDVAGEVTAIGSGVVDFAVGDTVFGMPRFPGQAATYAEYVAAPAAEIAAIPASLDFEAAGALPLAGLTAWQALVDTAGLRAGQRVLIHAGAGGVGHIAVQIAKARGAHVVATASAGKLEIVRELGADEVVDYRAEDFTRGGAVFDIVLDPIGGDHAERSVAVLKRGGTLVCLLDPSTKAKAAAERAGVALTRIIVRPDAVGLRALAALADAGQLAVRVARAFPLAEAGAAQAFLETRPVGKVVLLP